MSDDKQITRQDFLANCGRGAALLLLGGAAGTLAQRTARSRQVWQIDPAKCIQCGQCADYCVLDQSAVRCFHTYPICGYCDLCSGFFKTDHNALNEGAENQMCPAAAIRRSFVSQPYFQYTIDEEKCVGCGRCVKGCVKYGNGSLYLQVKQSLCVNCNQCNIAANCPSNAFVRLPADAPYLDRLPKQEPKV